MHQNAYLNNCLQENFARKLTDILLGVFRTNNEDTNVEPCIDAFRKHQHMPVPGVVRRNRTDNEQVNNPMCLHVFASL